MELLQLKYFCDAAVSENFSVTAKKFTVPPSNISQSVKRLERELGVQLFDRKANSIRLNEKGRAFYESISEALCLIDEAQQRAIERYNEGKIKICVNSNRRIVIQAIEKFKKQRPEVTINTEYGGDASDTDFDFVISGKHHAYTHLVCERKIKEDICLAVPADSKLAVAERVNIKDLKCESFVAMGEKSDLHGLTRQICADFGFEPHVAIQGDDPFYVRKCVEMGLGICFVPMLSWKGQFSDKVVIKNIGSYSREAFVYKNIRKHSSKYALEFLGMLVNEFDLETK